MAARDLGRQIAVTGVYGIGQFLVLVGRLLAHAIRVGLGPQIQADPGADLG